MSDRFQVQTKMKRRILIGAFCLLLLALLSGIGFHSLRAADQDDDSGYSQIAIFAKAVQLIRQDYVDGDKTSYHNLITAALKGMLGSLDPHSQFMDPSDFRDMQEDTRSRFNGLGIEVAIKNGLPTVVTPMEDTPAARAGILSGDQILKINGASTDRMDLQDVINHLRGAPGQKISLTLIRPSTKEVKDYALERAEIKVQSVKGARLLDPDLTGSFKIAYVRLIQFNEPTANELSKALDELQRQGMTKVVSTQGRVASQQREYTTSGAAKERPHFPMAVLVNEGSASGAEIVSGALKDLHRAIVVGETTFGKGSVQNVMQLPDGSALRFTTAKYYTPSKQVIHGNGVTPNIRVPMSVEQERQLFTARSSGDTIKPDEDKNFIKSTDPQMLRAIDALKGVMIYAQQNTPKGEAIKK